MYVYVSASDLLSSNFVTNPINTFSLNNYICLLLLNNYRQCTYALSYLTQVLRISDCTYVLIYLLPTISFPALYFDTTVKHFSIILYL